MTPRTERQRIDRVVEKAICKHCPGNLGHISPAEAETLILRKMAKERAWMRRRVNKEIAHQAKYKDDVSRGYVREMLRDLLAVLGRKG